MKNIRSPGISFVPSKIRPNDSHSISINEKGRGIEKSEGPLYRKSSSSSTSKTTYGGHSGSGSLIRNRQTDVITVNLDDIRNRLARLQRVSDKQIRSLQGQDLEDYQALVRYMRLLYDTDAYKQFHDEVKSKFPPRPDGPVAGSVEAFFTGCVTAVGSVPSSGGDNIDNLPPGCAAICAGAMPLPKETAGSESNFCPYTVVIAVSQPGAAYEMKTLYEGANKDQLIVYIDTRGKEFTGFNDEEKAQLAKYNAKTIKLLKYLPDKKTYIDVTNGTGSYQELPSRVDVIPTTSSSTVGSGSLFVILLLILIALAIFIGWRIVASRKA